jgi:hypothetical protein
MPAPQKPTHRHHVAGTGVEHVGRIGLHRHRVNASHVFGKQHRPSSANGVEGGHRHTKEQS